jgi:hypothetical protein
VAESTVEVNAIIRLRAQQLRQDKEQAKKEFQDLKKEAEKPTQLAVETKPAEQAVDRVEKEIKDVRAEAAKPIPISVDTAKAIEPLTKMREQLAQMRADLAGTSQRLAARQQQLQSEIAASGGPAGAGGGPFFRPDRGAINEFRTGMDMVLKTVIAIDATISAIDIGISSAKLATALISGDADDIAHSAKEMETAIRGIPLVGDRIADLGAKINEMFTGAAAQAKSIADSAELANQAIDAQRASVEATNRALEDQQEIIDDLIRRREKLGLKGTDREQAQVEDRAASDRKRIEDQAKRDSEEVKDAADKAIEARKRALKIQQDRVDALGPKRTITQGQLDDAGAAFATSRDIQHNEDVDIAIRDRDSANARLLEAEKQRDKSIEKINDAKNKALVEADKTAAAEREQIDKDALDRRTRKEQEAVRRMNAERQKMDQQEAREREQAQEEAERKAEKEDRESERQREQSIRDQKRAIEEIRQEEERAAREREQRIQRDTRFTTTREQMDRLQLATIAQAATAGTDVIGNVRRASQPNRVTGHDIFGGERREGTITDKEQLDVLKQIAENTKVSPEDFGEFIPD